MNENQPGSIDAIREERFVETEADAFVLFEHQAGINGVPCARLAPLEHYLHAVRSLLGNGLRGPRRRGGKHQDAQRGATLMRARQQTDTVRVPHTPIGA